MIRATLPVVDRTRAASSDFERALEGRGLAPLVRGKVTTLQVNVGKLCNQACHHCHVEAGPKRTEIMPRAIAERTIALLAASPGIDTVDITGGAPELCPSFRWLVVEARRLGRRTIDRCNLTILFEPGQKGLAEFLAGNEVAIIASLPCYLEKNVDRQRGRGVFEKSIRALQLLNDLGYARQGTGLALDLVYNPLGASLPPPQAQLEADYREQLRSRFGIDFDRLLTITNMPVRRFADDLHRTGKLEAYMSLLVAHFNPATVTGLMCRSLVSVAFDGELYDCDFNQMLDIPLGGRMTGETPRRRTVFEVGSFEPLEGARIATGAHCFGCTAGAGSGCGGAIA